MTWAVVCEEHFKGQWDLLILEAASDSVEVVNLMIQVYLNDFTGNSGGIYRYYILNCSTFTEKNIHPWMLFTFIPR